MILDELNEFADATSVAAAASTALIGDVIDLGANGEQVGDGEGLFLVIQCSTSIITAGSAGTIQFVLASDAQAVITVDGSETRHLLTEEYVTDGDDANDLDAGDYIFVGRLPSGGGVAYERYLGVLAIVGTTEVTAGAINAFLTKDAPRGVLYPAATGA